MDSAVANPTFSHALNLLRVQIVCVPVSDGPAMTHVEYFRSDESKAKWFAADHYDKPEELGCTSIWAVVSDDGAYFSPKPGICYPMSDIL